MLLRTEIFSFIFVCSYCKSTTLSWFRFYLPAVIHRCQRHQRDMEDILESLKAVHWENCVNLHIRRRVWCRFDFHLLACDINGSVLALSNISARQTRKTTKFAHKKTAIFDLDHQSDGRSHLVCAFERLKSNSSMLGPIRVRARIVDHEISIEIERAV